MTELLAASPLARAVALALVEFVWQGAAIGLAAAVVLALLRRASAQARYVVACLGLAAMTIAPGITAAGYLRLPPDSADMPGTPALVSIGKSAAFAGSGGAEVVAVAPRTRLAAWLEPRLPLVLAIWSAGVLMMAAHLFAGWVRVTRIRRRATLLDPKRWPSRALEMARQFRITRRVRLLVTSAVDVPAVVGCIRPAILVPSSALAGLSPDHLEAILLHELAHVRRADYLVNVMQCVVEVLLFYHPAVWWLSSQIRREREHCCDDAAAALCADEVTYAHALTSLEELRVARPRLAVGADGGDLLARIRRLIEPERVSSPRLSGGLVMSVVFTLVLVALNVPIASSAGESPRQAPVAPPQEIRTTTIAAVPSVQPTQTPVDRSPGPFSPASATAAEISAVVGQAKTGTAGVAGVVRDTDGGVMPGVAIALGRGSETSFTSMTNARGEFAIADVPAGVYDLTASLTGFRTGRSTIDLPAGQTRRFEIHLNIGRLTETVTIAPPGAEDRPPTVSQQMPANPQTAEEHLVAAQSLYAQRRYDEAARHLERALELLRGEARASTIEEAQAAVVNPGEPIRVGGSIREPRKIRHVPPVYPPEALAANVQGVVILEAVIATDGSVTDLKLLRSIPLLDQAAVGAVRQWLFTPTMLNGKPVEVAVTITVNFAR